MRLIVEIQTQLESILLEIAAMEIRLAYVRKQVNLADTPHSSDTNASPYYLELPDADNPGNVEIKKNSFLHGHDRVD